MNKAVKWVLIAVGVAVASNVIREALKASDEVDAGLALEASCTRMAEQSAGVPADRVALVCRCTREKTAEAVGAAGVVRLAKVTEATEADRLGMIASVAACTEEFAPPTR